MPREEDPAQRVRRDVGEAERAGAIGVRRLDVREPLDGRAICEKLEPAALHHRVVLPRGAQRSTALARRDLDADRARPDGQRSLLEDRRGAIGADAHGHVLDAGDAGLNGERCLRLVLSHEHCIARAVVEPAADAPLGVLVGLAGEDGGAGHPRVEAAEGVRLGLADAELGHRRRVEPGAVAPPGEQHHRVAARDRVEREARGAGILGDVGADEGAEPRAGRRRLRRALDEREQLVQRGPWARGEHRRIVDHRERGRGDVDVGVVEARDERAAAEVDDLCAREREREDLLLVAHGQDPGALDGDGVRPRRAGVGGEDVAVMKDDAGRRCRRLRAEQEREDGCEKRETARSGEPSLRRRSSSGTSDAGRHGRGHETSLLVELERCEGRSPLRGRAATRSSRGCDGPG